MWKARAAAVVLLGVLYGCGGSPVGPSEVTATPVEVGSVRSASLPAGLDPEYVRALAVVSVDGRPKRWEGGPFRHCYGPEIDAAVVNETAARMTVITGIPRTEAGPCNVTWVIDPTIPTPAHAELAGTETAIYTAKLVFMVPYALVKAVHERRRTLRHGVTRALARYEDGPVRGGILP
jgi:hypothetical protein